MTAFTRHIRAGAHPPIDTRIPHRDPEFAFPVDHRVSRAEQEDDHAGQPFGWLLVAVLITVPCALLGFWIAS